jgi:predicted sulfurtransferase
MFKMPKATLISLLLMILVALLASCGSSHSQVPRVDKEKVKGWLDDPAVMIIDVRASGDWETSDKKVKGAVRQDPNKADDWAKDLPKDKKIVIYCA